MDYPNPNKNYDIHERLGIQIVENYETDARCTQRGQVRRQSKVSAYSEHISGQASIIILLNPTKTCSSIQSIQITVIFKNYIKEFFKQGKPPVQALWISLARL